MDGEDGKSDTKDDVGRAYPGQTAAVTAKTAFGCVTPGKSDGDLFQIPQS